MHGPSCQNGSAQDAGAIKDHRKRKGTAQYPCISPVGGGQLPHWNKSAGRSDDRNRKDVSPELQKGYVFFFCVFRMRTDGIRRQRTYYIQQDRLRDKQKRRKK